ncbi:hypothetical protein ACIQU5_36005 [Streptomyces sp. NPDC090306]|uniref:hypothetical protein n=1 Tax=Streptomyces sp. NPDC090306 TaxID=3365961 RepID=UPI003808BBF9
MNNHQGRQLDRSIERIRADNLPAHYGFDTGLGHDLVAVVAGLALPYSSGAVVIAMVVTVCENLPTKFSAIVRARS